MAAADQAKYLQLAESLTGFRSKLRLRAETLDIRERQQILRLLVKEVLVSATTITIRHSIPVPTPGPGSISTPGSASGNFGALPKAGYLLRKGSNHRTLRCPALTREELPITIASRRQHCPYEAQHPAIRYTLCNKR